MELEELLNFIRLNPGLNTEQMLFRLGLDLEYGQAFLRALEDLGRIRFKDGVGWLPVQYLDAQ